MRAVRYDSQLFSSRNVLGSSTQVNKDILTWITGASESQLEFSHQWRSKAEPDHPGGRLLATGSVLGHAKHRGDVCWGSGLHEKTFSMLGACALPPPPVGHPRSIVTSQPAAEASLCVWDTQAATARTWWGCGARSARPSCSRRARTASSHHVCWGTRRCCSRSCGPR